jgi:hypothetical protein
MEIFKTTKSMVLLHRTHSSSSAAHSVDTTKKEIVSSDDEKSSPITICIPFALGVAALGVAGIGVGLMAAGFTLSGIAAHSKPTQAGIGNVAVGSSFAAHQSFGDLGGPVVMASLGVVGTALLLVL